MHLYKIDSFVFCFNNAVLNPPLHSERSWWGKGHDEVSVAQISRELASFERGGPRFNWTDIHWINAESGSKIRGWTLAYWLLIFQPVVATIALLGIEVGRFREMGVRWTLASEKYGRSTEYCVIWVIVAACDWSPSSQLKKRGRNEKCLKVSKRENKWQWIQKHTFDSLRIKRKRIYLKKKKRKKIWHVRCNFSFNKNEASMAGRIY